VDAEHVVWAVDDLRLPVAHILRVPFGDQPGDGLASRVPFGDQPGDGLESFREEFPDPSTARKDLHRPPSQRAPRVLGAAFG
jgi:hypothetical protein